MFWAHLGVVGLVAGSSVRARAGSDYGAYSRACIGGDYDRSSASDYEAYSVHTWDIYTSDYNRSVGGDYEAYSASKLLLEPPQRRA